MKKVGWFDIYVNDMDRAQKFYETVLGTTLTPMDDPNDDSVQMRTFEDDYVSHGAGGALVKMEHASPGPGGTAVYFTCDDCSVDAVRGPQSGRSGAVLRLRS